MNKKEIAQQFTRQTLEPNQPSIAFGQVTDMLKEIEQLHSKVLSNTEEFRIQQRIVEAGFQSLRSRLQDLRKPIEQTGRAVDGIVGQAGEISKVIPLAALLDRSGGGDRVGAYHESTVDGDCLLKRRRKKKKGVRL